MKKLLIAASIAIAFSMTAHADVKLSNGDQLGPALDDVRISLSDNFNRALEVAQRRLGLSLSEATTLVTAIQNGSTFTTVDQINTVVNGGSSGNGNGNNGNGNGNGGSSSYVKTDDYAADKTAQDKRDDGQDAALVTETQQRKDTDANLQTQVDGKVSQTDFAADQARQDAALADETTARQSGDAALGAGLTAEASTRADADKNLQTQIDGKVDKTTYADDKTAQAGRDSAQDDHINAVQGAAQTANDRATALEGRADSTESAIRETNAQLEVTDARSINNAVRLDGVEQKNADQDVEIAKKVDTSTFEADQARQDKVIATKVDTSTFETDQARQDAALSSETESRTSADSALNTKINTNKAEQAVVDGRQDSLIGRNAFAIETEAATRDAADTYAQSRIDTANANIEANRTALVNTNKRVAENTAAIANHEQRITSLESQVNSGFSSLRNQIDKVEKRADAGIAGVAAMANIPQVTNTQTFSVGAGVGARGDQQALAVGFSARVSENVVTKVSVAADTQDKFSVGAGIAYGW